MTCDPKLFDSYANLLIVQYYDKPKARGLLKAFIEQIFLNCIAVQVQNGFNLDAATGDQLDTIGKYVGFSRFVPAYNFPGTFFSYILYTDSQIQIDDKPGYTRYDNPSAGGRYLRYDNDSNASERLLDDTYREILRMKIFTNNSYISMHQINEFFVENYGAAVTIVDNYDMSITYQINQSEYFLIFDLVQHLNILPAPAGVKVNLTS